VLVEGKSEHGRARALSPAPQPRPSQPPSRETQMKEEGRRNRDGVSNSFTAGVAAATLIPSPRF